LSDSAVLTRGKFNITFHFQIICETTSNDNYVWSEWEDMWKAGMKRVKEAN
jgi:hypothetical protein